MQIVKVLPEWWLNPGSAELAKLGMLRKFVEGVGGGKGLARHGVIEAVKIVKMLGDVDT